MKTIAVALFVLSLAACSSHSTRYVHSDGNGSHAAGAARQGEEVVCHKGKKTMSLPASAVQAHLGHGDRRGPC